MSRVLAAASALLVLAGAWSVAAEQHAASVAPQAIARSAPAKLLPGTRSSVLTLIQGNALSSTNQQLPGVLVRLRDARFGRVVETQLTDKSGMFAFKVVDPGSYIVELIGNDQSLLAASQILNVNAGENISAIVKLPFRIPPFAGLMGSSSTSSAVLLAAQAAASGIAAVVPTTPISPLQ